MSMAKPELMGRGVGEAALFFGGKRISWIGTLATVACPVQRERASKRGGRWIEGRCRSVSRRPWVVLRVENCSVLSPCVDERCGDAVRGRERE